jgi:hypothetical protein
MGILALIIGEVIILLIVIYFLFIKNINKIKTVDNKEIPPTDEPLNIPTGIYSSIEKKKVDVGGNDLIPFDTTDDDLQILKMFNEK